MTRSEINNDTPAAIGAAAIVAEDVRMADQQSRRQSWMIVALLFMFMMINFADKIIIGLAGVPIMTDLKLTPKEFGLVGSSFFFLFSISAVVTGFIVNRIKSKTALLVMGIIWALGRHGIADRLPHRSRRR